MKRIWIFCSVLANRIINFMSIVLTKKEGSVIGGYWVRVFDKNILKRLDLPKIIIGITGSSGKSSTTELVSHIFKESNFTVAYNKEGSNTINGITSLILSNTSFSGHFKKDVLLMELDEKFMKTIFSYFKPTHIVITNITRDQPPRNTSPDLIYNEIKSAIKGDEHLILNADDPFVLRFSFGHKGKITTFGMDKNNYSYPNKLHNIDGVYCPLCNTKLKYDYYHYGHIGKYKCPNNDFDRGKINFLADSIDIKNQTIKINKDKVHLSSNFLYTVYFTTAAYAITSECGIDKNNILEAINVNRLKTKRLNIYNFDNRNWQMLVSKNENNLSYKQSLDFILHQSGKKTIILGFDTSSRRYKENDISWLWDIDFELLSDKSIDKIIVIGKFRYDVITRLEYAGIKKDKLILLNDTKKIINTLKEKTKGNIYSMVCFDKEMELISLLKEENHEN